MAGFLLEFAADPRRYVKNSGEVFWKAARRCLESESVKQSRACTYGHCPKNGARHNGMTVRKGLNWLQTHGPFN